MKELNKQVMKSQYLEMKKYFNMNLNEYIPMKFDREKYFRSNEGKRATNGI